MDIFVGNGIISSSISCDALSSYIAVSSMSKSNCDYVMFNARQIEYVLCGDFTLSTRKRNCIKQAISELVECGLFSVIVNNKEEYIIDNVFSVESNFTIVTLDEVRTIMCMNNKLDRFAILKYWMFLVSTMNSCKSDKYYGCGWWTIDKLSEATSIHKNSILAYNTLLEDSKLLYVYRPNCTFANEEIVTRCNNTYGRYNDKANVTKCAIEHLNMLDSHSNNPKGNISVVDGRSVSARYNHFINGVKQGKAYDIEFVRKLNYECELYNENYKCYPNAKLKDLTIFDEYLRGERYGA